VFKRWRLREVKVLVLCLLLAFGVMGAAGSPAQRDTNGIIALYTDWGTQDQYVGVVKGVMLSIFREATLVNITHDIPPFDLTIEAVELLRASAEEFPSGTVFLAVVDPGVGGERRPIVVHTEDNKFFVGPDNGLFTPQILEGVKGIYEITNEKFMRPGPISYTFHGRDIFSPAAAHLAAGRCVTEVGPEIDDPELLDIGLAYVEDDTITGEIWLIDTYGNLGTNIFREELDELGLVKMEHTLKVTIGEETRRVPFVRTYGDVPAQEDLAYISSRDALHLAINLGNAAESWGAEVGDTISIELVEDE